MNNSSVIIFSQSCLSDRLYYVCVNGKLSAVGIIQSGVPQVSILGLLRFSMIYHCTYKEKIRNSLFADTSSLDTSEINCKENRVKLQTDLKEASDWCKNNQMWSHPFTFHLSPRFCPAIAECCPPSMPFVVFSLLVSCSRWFPPSLLCRLAIFY